MTTNYDMEAIHKAYPYPAVCRIECGGPDEGIWDADGNAVTVDQSKVDAARVELDKLNTDDFIKILTHPKSALIKQYVALMEAEGVTLKFNNANPKSRLFKKGMVQLNRLRL